MRYRNIHDAAVTDGMTFEIPPGEIGDGPDGLISPWLVPVNDETDEMTDGAPGEPTPPAETPTTAAESTDPGPAKKTAKKAAAQQSEAPAAASDAAPSEE